MIICPLKKAKTCEHIELKSLLEFLQESKYIYFPEDDNIGFKENFGVTFKEAVGFDSITAALDKRDIVRIKVYISEDECLFAVYYLGTPPSKLKESKEEARVRVIANKEAERNAEKFFSELEAKFGVLLTDVEIEDSKVVPSVGQAHIGM